MSKELFFKALEAVKTNNQKLAIEIIENPEFRFSYYKGEEKLNDPDYNKKTMPLLAYAIEQGQVEVAKSIISNKHFDYSKEVEYSGSDKAIKIMPLLAYAIERNQQEIIDLIVSKEQFNSNERIFARKYQSDATSIPLLAYAIEHNQLKLAEHIVSSNKFDPNVRMLTELYGQEKALLGYVIEQGATEIGKSILANNSFNPNVNLFSKTYRGDTKYSGPKLIEYMIEKDQVELVKTCLQKPYSYDKRLIVSKEIEQALLKYAAEKDLELTLLLLQRSDCEVNAQSVELLKSSLSKATEVEQTQIITAVSKRPELVLATIKNYQENNDLETFINLIEKLGVADTIMLNAARQDKPELVKELLDLAPIEKNSFSINAERNKETLGTVTHSENVAMKEFLFERGYLPRGEELLPLKKEERSLGDIATEDHGASEDGPVKEATRFYIKETLANLKEPDPIKLAQSAVELKEKLQTLKTEVNNGNFDNVPKDLLKLSKTEQEDTFRDYYLKGKEGKLTPADLADLSTRFAKPENAAKEIINKSADFMQNTILNTYKDSTYAYENPYGPGEKKLTTPQIVGAVYELQKNTEKQKDNIELVKELYMSATAYGTDLGHPSCQPGTVTRIMNSTFSIEPKLQQKYEEYQTRIKDRITVQNVGGLAVEIANDLVKTHGKTQAVENYLVGSVVPYGEKQSQKDIDQVAKIVNNLFKAHIEKTMPGFGTRLPSKTEMQIMTTAVTNTEQAREFREQIKPPEMNNDKIKEQAAAYKAKIESIRKNQLKKNLTKASEEIGEILKKPDIMNELKTLHKNRFEVDNPKEQKYSSVEKRESFVEKLGGQRRNQSQDRSK